MWIQPREMGWNDQVGIETFSAKLEVFHENMVRSMVLLFKLHQDMLENPPIFSGPWPSDPWWGALHQVITDGYSAIPTTKNFLKIWVPSGNLT